MLISLLQNAPAPGTAPNPLLQFAPMIFIFIIFYFLLIAPMRKKQKKVQAMLANLKKGDEVVTTGGIFGRIAAIDEERGFVVLEISSNVKVKAQRGAIAGLAADPEKPAP